MSRKQLDPRLRERLEAGTLGPQELILASRIYEEESTLKSWWYVASTITIQALVVAGVLVLPRHPAWPWLAAKLTLGVLGGFVQVRLHAIYHDVMHGAMLRNSKVAGTLFSVVALYSLLPRAWYKENHDFHHQNNGKLEFLTLERALKGTLAGFPLLTEEQRRTISAEKLKLYELGRHPITIFFGYIFVTIGFQNLMPFIRNPRKYWAGLVGPLLHVGLFGQASFSYGMWTGLCAVVVPAFVSRGMLAYMFFVQHNYPDAKFQSGSDWDYTFAALHNSSMFEMSPLMHWFTGNEGYHHVHHLNHKIPFYRLPEAMKGIPQLRNPGRTSWRLRDITACFAVNVWSPERNRMLTSAERSEASL